jgi:acylphosphatase
MTPDHAALRVTIYGHVQGIGFRDATTRRAHELGVLGWVRNGADGTVQAHIEGAPAAVDELLAFLRTGPPHAQVTTVETEPTAPEGHEQFAIRGIPAGVFVVQEHAATTHHFDLRLEVDGVMRSWARLSGKVLAILANDARRVTGAQRAWRCSFGSAGGCCYPVVVELCEVVGGGDQSPFR